MSTGSIMHNELSNAGMYTDMSGLAKLRAQASQKSPEASKEVARQFEALFIQTMLKAMRQASHLSESTDGEQTRFYQDMYDKQIALDLARKESIGLASILQRQLAGPAESNTVSRSAAPMQSPATKPLTETQSHWEPASPEAFIKDLWPHASNSAKALGVSADILVAQAALETGWGKRMIHHQHGGNAFNLFGIKADERWQGDRVNVSTVEYRDGIARREQASFRAYASMAEGMDDYVNFLNQNPRYQQALEQANNAEHFLQELQHAGYATDPAYAEKIRNIMNRESFSQVITDLQTADASTNGQSV